MMRNSWAGWAARKMPGNVRFKEDHFMYKMGITFSLDLDNSEILRCILYFFFTPGNTWICLFKVFVCCYTPRF